MFICNRPRNGNSLTVRHVMKKLTCCCSVAKSCLTLLWPRGLARQAPLFMAFSRQECWSDLPFPSPGASPCPRDPTRVSSLQLDSLWSEPPGKPVDEAVHTKLQIKNLCGYPFLLLRHYPTSLYWNLSYRFGHNQHSLYTIVRGSQLGKGSWTSISKWMPDTVRREER